VITLRRRRTPRSVPELFAKAERLVAANRGLEAIDLLTDANRTSPHFEIEARLVQLRHDAFDSVPVSSGLRDWPPTAPDLFPDVELPEVAPQDFTAATLRSGILRHGCLVVRGLVPPARVRQLRDDIDAAMTAFESRERDSRANSTPWFVPF